MAASCIGAIQTAELFILVPTVLLLTRSPGRGHAIAVVGAKTHAAKNVHDVSSGRVHGQNVERSVGEVCDVA